MRRIGRIWLPFAVALTVVLAAMAWVSATVLRLDRAERRANLQAADDERIRLAFWRMDSALIPLVVRESARPHYVYSAFHALTPVYAPASQPFGREALVASPLLTFESEDILLHFQIDPDGRITSPQVPTGNQLDLATDGHRTARQIAAAGERLRRLQALADRRKLLALLPAPLPSPGVVAAAQDGTARQATALRDEVNQQLLDSLQSLRRRGGSFNRGDATRVLNTGEYIARTNAARRAQAAMDQAASVGTAPVPVSEGALLPCWLGEQLLLARRVQVGGREYIQGCWLNWPGLRRWLLTSVADLLPSASLVPAPSAEPAPTEELPESGQTYRLAAVPVRLHPGSVPAELALPPSPVPGSLLVAWACVLLAAAAVAVVLGKAVSLSERRGAFVSAVTHELRTPLTTFRLYADMLANGMVTDEAKRTGYLRRLRDEADRLSHLVENVLAYARLSGPRSADHMESTSLGEILDRSTERLAALAERAGMTLLVRTDADARGTPVRCNTSAVEQILLNLVDNACKYAGRAEDRTLVLQAGRSDGLGALRVCDRGPGVSRPDARRLFHPFRKSARRAAASAPGIGLGLALSRRLARTMRGDLRYEPRAGGGAAFVLTLPRDDGPPA